MSMGKFYPEFLFEYQGLSCWENQHGFFTYQIIEETQTIYVPDIYVQPSSRGKSEARVLMDQACEIGRENNCKRLLGVVRSNYANKEHSLKCALGYGMSILSTSSTEIYVAKEI